MLQADTVVFKHQYITTPTVSKADELVEVANKLTQVLRDKTMTNNETTDKQKLMQLADIFKVVCNKNTQARSR